jgi:hypothetical protein
MTRWLRGLPATSDRQIYLSSGALQIVANQTSLDDLSLLQSWHEERHLEAFALKAPGLTGVTLDLLLFPRVNREEMKGRTVHLSVSGVLVRLASIDDLIALKEVAGRPVDLADIAHLRKIQRP